MYVPTIELHKAETLEDAGALLGQYAPDAKILAGGTDLLVDLKTNRISASHIISISSISGLKGITKTGESLRIGALTTINELIDSQEVKDFTPVIYEAASQMAAPPVRSIATVGGNIASAVPCADLPPVLMVLNASIIIWSLNGERSELIKNVFVSPRETILAEDEILVAVTVPVPQSGFGAAYERIALRDGNSIAVASVAVGLTLDSDMTVQDGLLALGAVAPTPRYLAEFSEMVKGRRLDDDLIAIAAEHAMSNADPISDVRGSAEFRKDLIGVLTKRAIMKAAQRAQERL